ACDADRAAPRTRTASALDSPLADNWPTAADSFGAAGSRLRPASVGSSSWAGLHSRPLTAAAGSCPALADSRPTIVDSAPGLVDGRPAIVDKRRPPVVVHSSGSGPESWLAAVDSSAAAGNWLTVVCRARTMRTAAGSYQMAVDKPVATASADKPA